MQRHTQNEIVWLTFTLFAECPRLTHGIFLRHGGVSSQSFSSLNFGLTQGDLPSLVATNRQKALQILGIEKYTALCQIHSDRIVEAHPDSTEQGDGLITDQIGLGLMILHADCQAAIFYDPIQHAVANIHSGWRGNVANIYQKTVEMMRARYGSKPENLLVGVSPSLGPQAAEFRHYQTELPSPFWSYQVSPTYFDFWEISHWQLTSCGILPCHIEIAKQCTYSHPEDFFSYRRIKASGRHATLAVLV